MRQIIYKRFYFAEWSNKTHHMTHQQRGIFLALMDMYFDNATAENGKLDATDFELLCWRLGCKTVGEISDLKMIIKAEFKKVGNSYRHRDWDGEIKNIMHKIKTGDYYNELNGNAESNALSNTKNNKDNVHTPMTNAQRQARCRQRKKMIKDLKDVNITVENGLTFDEVCQIFKSVFDKKYEKNSNGNQQENNDSNNAYNAQKSPNNHKLLTNTNKKRESEKQDFSSHTHTKNKIFKDSIDKWQPPTLDEIRSLLMQEEAFQVILTEEIYDNHIKKFTNYWVNQEAQGNRLATQQIRTDKLVSWIIRERPVFTSNATNVSQEISQNAVFDPQNCIVIDGRYQPCFDDMSKQQTLDTIKKYRLPQESTAEAYHRISQAGVQNCTIHKVASPDFVKKLASNFGAA